MATNHSPENGDGSGSKVPKFFKIVSNTGAHRLRLPTEFTRRHGHDLADPVFLEVPSGLVWKVELIHSEGETWLYRGWQRFAEYYSIHFGHLLVFEYAGNSHFEVLIFDTTATEIEYFHYDSLDRGLNQAEGIESGSFVFVKETLKGKDARSEDDQDDDVEVIDNHLPSSLENKRRMHPVKLRKSSCTDQKSSFPRYMYDHERSQGTKPKCSDRKRGVDDIFEAYTRAVAFMSDKPTRNPFSIVVMHPSYVKTKHSAVRIPTPFARQVLPGGGNSLILHVSEGKTWPVRCIRRQAKACITTGWRKFVEDNDLKVGDACVLRGSSSHGMLSFFAVDGI